MKLFFFESEIKMPVMCLHLRSTVIQTSKGVIVVSPIHFTAEQLQQIRQLGRVTDIVAPSVLHHLFIPEAIQSFPDATVWGVEGLEKKRPDIKWQKKFNADHWPYQDEIEVTVIEGVPRMTEVALFCREIRTLIVTDLCFNLQKTKGWGAFILLHIMGTYQQFAVSRLVSRFLDDRSAFEASLRRIWNWDFEQIVMAHGEILPKNGKQMLQQALQKRGFHVS